MSQISKIQQRVNLHKDLHWIETNRLQLTYLEKSEDFRIKDLKYPYQLFQYLSINEDLELRKEVNDFLISKIKEKLDKLIKELDNDITEK